MTFVDRRCFAATCRDHQRSLTCLWDVDAAMINVKMGRSLADARDNKNRPSSTIAGYMDRHSRVNYPGPGKLYSCMIVRTSVLIPELS